MLTNQCLRILVHGVCVRWTRQALRCDNIVPRNASPNSGGIHRCLRNNIHTCCYSVRHHRVHVPQLTRMHCTTTSYVVCTCPLCTVLECLVAALSRMGDVCLLINAARYAGYIIFGDVSDGNILNLFEGNELMAMV